MTNFSRRSVLSGVTAVGTGALTGVTAAPAGSRGGAAPGLLTVRPGDDRYPALVVGSNQRYVAAPEAVHLVRTTEEVTAAVGRAVAAGRRLSVRSGGHCYADLVYHAAAEVIVDLSTMTRIEYDPERRAVMVEAGARLGEIYETLYRAWGVTIPGGICPYVGIGGHATGGGYGVLSRRHGVVADHVEAVEMVVVDGAGRARAVVASRDSPGDLRELWWAACGGGGGSFGVVTRFWFRSPGAADGAGPGGLLPRPPASLLVNYTGLPWERLPREAFQRLLRNYTGWFARHQDPDPRHDSLSGGLFLRLSGEQAQILTVTDGTMPGAPELIEGFLAEIGEGVGLTAGPTRRLPWLTATRVMGNADSATLNNMTMRSAVKSAYLRAGLSERQCAAIYRNLTTPDYRNPTATFTIYAAGGGASSAVPRDAVAYAHRDVAYLTLVENFWTDPGEDAAHLAWSRRLYGELFEDTGGYPVPNDRTDGCYVNSPDPDILDPARNRSGVPWPELYWPGNYTRLQRVKRRWDPGDVFRHAQSVRLPEGP